jgi:hypothetical protein
MSLQRNVSASSGPRIPRRHVFKRAMTPRRPVSLSHSKPLTSVLDIAPADWATGHHVSICIHLHRARGLYCGISRTADILFTRNWSEVAMGMHWVWFRRPLHFNVLRRAPDTLQDRHRHPGSQYLRQCKPQWLESVRMRSSHAID